MQITTTEHFIDNFLIGYSAHSNVRMIPFIGDGLKEAQRKAAYGILKRGANQNTDTVERIAAAVCSLTSYHHGAGSMETTICNMAQNFPGSNNLPLFEAHGQFGNRLNSTPSASRYIKTKLSKYFRLLYRQEDDLILEYHHDNGDQIEPICFISLLPMPLVNGVDGVGTGHSSYIYSYNPTELRDMILDLLSNKKIDCGNLLPYWNGFKGKVTKDLAGQVTTTGNFLVEQGKRGKTIIKITELPISIQGDNYKKHLMNLEEKDVIISFDDLSDEAGFDYHVEVAADFDLSDNNIIKVFKLAEKNTENFTVWNSKGVLQRFGSAEELLIDFVKWRLTKYADRKAALIAKYNADIVWANEKIRFIRYYIANHLMFRDTSTKELVVILKKENFERHDELLAMPIRNLTYDKIKELEKDLEKIKALLEATQKDTPAIMYKRELKEFVL